MKWYNDPEFWSDVNLWAFGILFGIIVCVITIAVFSSGC